VSIEASTSKQRNGPLNPAGGACITQNHNSQIQERPRDVLSLIKLDILAYTRVITNYPPLALVTLRERSLGYKWPESPSQSLPPKYTSSVYHITPSISLPIKQRSRGVLFITNVHLPFAQTSALIIYTKLLHQAPTYPSQ
jgi:hypothetical protein